MGRLRHRQIELGDGGRLDHQRPLLTRLFDGGLRQADPLEVGLSPPQRGIVGTDAFQRVTKLQQVILGFRVGTEQFEQGIGDPLAQGILHIGAAALTAIQESPRFQALDGFAQGRPRHLKLDGEFPLGGQLLPRLQAAFQNHAFQLGDDGVGQLGLSYLDIGHEATLLNWYYQFYDWGEN